jgi:LEA14-like dessication related protein
MKRARVALTATLLAVIMGGCASLDIGGGPEVRAVRPRITGIDFRGVDLAFDVDVNNPYPMAIRSPEFRYGLDIEGAQFLESTGSSRIDLPALRTGTMTLPVRLSYANLWRTFKNLAGAAEVPYTLRGEIFTSALGQSFALPVRHSGTFPVLRPPTLSDVKIQLSDVSLRSAKIVADAAMKNPNAFALSLKDLGYVLRMGGGEVGGLTASTADTIGAGQTGRVRLTGTISAADALDKILKGGIGSASLNLSGSVGTPYGPAKLER